MNVVADLANDFLQWNKESAGPNWERFLEDVRRNVSEFSKDKDLFQATSPDEQ